MLHETVYNIWQLESPSRLATYPLCSKRYSAHMHIYNLSQPFQIQRLLVFFMFSPSHLPSRSPDFFARNPHPSRPKPALLCSDQSRPSQGSVPPPLIWARCRLLPGLGVPPPRPRRPLLQVHTAASYQDRSRGHAPPPPALSQHPTRRSDTIKAEAPAQARPRPHR
jgi:hypothetical protein